jgi:hypothetical protein
VLEYQYPLQRHAPKGQKTFQQALTLQVSTKLEINSLTLGPLGNTFPNHITYDFNAITTLMTFKLISLVQMYTSVFDFICPQNWSMYLLAENKFFISSNFCCSNMFCPKHPQLSEELHYPSNYSGQNVWHYSWIFSFAHRCQQICHISVYKYKLYMCVCIYAYSIYTYMHINICVYDVFAIDWRD